MEFVVLFLSPPFLCTASISCLELPFVPFKVSLRRHIPLFQHLNSKMISEGTATFEDTVKKTVLCVFKERRRPVTFITSADKNVEWKNLLDAVRASFADVLSCGEGTSDAKSHFLQTESSEWGRIDLTGCVEDRATVYLCYSAGVSSIVLIIFVACPGPL